MSLTMLLLTILSVACACTIVASIKSPVSLDLAKDAVGNPTNLAVIPSHPHDVCYNDDDLGCFSMSSPWYTLLRPLPTPHRPANIGTQFYLYTRQRPERLVIIPSRYEKSLKASNYDGTKTTFFITHGFASDGNGTWMREMKDAILKNNDGNVIIVDWGKGASHFNYFQVASNTRVVGAALAHLARYLISNHQSDPSRIHAIGHSLGAQISAYLGKRIHNVARITALDPAQPAFEGFDRQVRLDQSDANFIDVIHTSSRPFIPFIGLGMITAHGHIDYYMNGGWNQPGCVLPPKPNITSFFDLATVPVEVIANFISCPHGRSYEFLTASLKNPNCTFWGHRVNGVDKAIRVLTLGYASKNVIPGQDCANGTCSPLGFDDINYPGRGSFGIATGSREPFCVPEPEVDEVMRSFRQIDEQE